MVAPTLTCFVVSEEELGLSAVRMADTSFNPFDDWQMDVETNLDDIIGVVATSQPENAVAEVKIKVRLVAAIVLGTIFQISAKLRDSLSR